MSERLLHEKLREWANARPFSFNEAWREFDVSGNDNMLAAFADEIKRCYVPVPRFENGEPVGEGSETYYGTVEAIDVEVSDGGWGNYVMHFADGNCIEGTYSQLVPHADSLGKLREDMEAYADVGVSCIEDDVRGFAKRLEAIMEGMGR